VDVGHDPTCVNVSPTQEIVAVDLHHHRSRIAQLVARSDTRVRAPEQGTRPKVHYKGADEACLDPLRTRILDDGMIWADVRPGHPSPPAGAPVVARTAYTTEHPPTWGAHVSGYLTTKAVSAGAILVAAMAVAAGHGAQRALIGVLAPVVALVFVAATGALLVADLHQPRRFLYLLTRPQWRSWLVRGAWVLLAHSALAALWLLGGLVDPAGLVRGVAAPAAVAAALAAGYTAWLFGQCEGRDLWQTPLLLPLLLAQAVSAGAGALLVVAPFVDRPQSLTTLLYRLLLAGVAAQALLAFAELTSRGSVHVELAVREMTRGEGAVRFWLGGVALGMLVPAVLTAVALAVGGPAAPLGILAGLCAVVGLWAYEDAFVRAGQAVPLS
jgi:formate-dependent nitrite reductase membrane component NrfD